MWAQLCTTEVEAPLFCVQCIYVRTYVCESDGLHVYSMCLKSVFALHTRVHNAYVHTYVCLTMTCSGDMGAIEMSWTKLEGDELLEPTVCKVCTANPL